MNPDAAQNPREELEVRLTALLLGDLPELEADAVRRAIAADPALAALHRRLKETIELVRETAANPAGQTASQPEPLKLNEERREKLFAKFKTVAPEELSVARPRQIAWWVPMGIAAILMAIIGVALLPPRFVLAKAPSPSRHGMTPDSHKHFQFGPRADHHATCGDR